MLVYYFLYFLGKKQMKRLICSLITSVSLLLPSYADISGQWETGGAESIVEIQKKPNGELIGKIVSLKEPFDEDGKPFTDTENPNISKRDKPLIGLIILQGFKESNSHFYKGGTVYDPKTGKTYKAQITEVSPNRLELRGYVGIPTLGKTETWTKTN